MACGEPLGEPPRNVLIVTIDTLRADHLGCYGYFRDTSPSLDALAAESLVFDRCLAPVAQTLPTHTSLFTGLYPHEHGILGNRKEDQVYVPSPSVRLFADAMSSAGYDTAAFVAAEPVKRAGGLGPGFATWWEPVERKVRADVVIDQALAWLEQPRSRPVFLWVHLFDVHGNYQPPPPFDEMFVSDARQAAYLAELQVHERRSRRAGTAMSHNLYDGEVRFADQELGRLFGHFRERGEWDELVAVVTSDHGEGLMQHGLDGHGHIWLEQLRVPLLLKAPGLAPGRADVLLGSQDVVPTLLGRVPALAARVEPWLAQSTGCDVLEQSERPVLGQYPSQRQPMTHSIVQGRWRLIVGEGGTRLFDLEQDPHELEDIAASRPRVVERLLARLDVHLEQQRARGERLGAGALEAVSEERSTGLEALGYGGGDEDDEDDE
jgi:arylsulfatase